MAKGYKIGEPDIIKILSRLEGKIKPMEMDLLREKLNITGSYIQSHSSGASMNIGTNHEEIAQLKEENARLKGMLEVYKEQLAQKDKQIQELLYKDKREP